ncbi:protein phosphatase 2C domain-containing protein [Patescibacteria group bacterium]|nr:protein phosphatase 2C domain-containing protein [Patescibacteria group bacterium]
MDFEIAAGGITGTMHSDPLVSKANQDAFAIRRTNTAITALICDGCSKGPYSEVGAHIGARLFVEAIESQVAHIPVPSLTDELFPVILERVRLDVLAQIRGLANLMGGSFSETISDYFLFTVVGMVMTPLRTWTFSIGDGVFIVNGEITRLGPFPENEPPYPALGLVRSKIAPELLVFGVNKSCWTNQVDSILIGSDGVVDLVRAGEKELNLPGTKEPIGPISQFWEVDRYFAGPHWIRRRLVLANQFGVRLDRTGSDIIREYGLLPDDTTIVVVRRTPNREE